MKESRRVTLADDRLEERFDSIDKHLGRLDRHLERLDDRLDRIQIALICTLGGLSASMLALLAAAKF